MVTEGYLQVGFSFLHAFVYQGADQINEDNIFIMEWSFHSMKSL